MSKKSTHLNPVKLKMSLAQKASFASYRAQILVDEKRRKKIEKLQKINELRVATSSKRSKTPVLLGIIAVLVVLVVLIAFDDPHITNFVHNLTNSKTDHTTSASENATGNSPTSVPSSSPNSGSSSAPSSSTNSGNSGSTPNSNNSGDTNSGSAKLSDNVKIALLQHYSVNTFLDIKNTNPKDMASHIVNIIDSGANQVVVILDLKYNDTNRNDVKALAGNLLEILKDKLSTLSSIVVATSDNYYTERAKR
jgi:hypothetical protein